MKFSLTKNTKQFLGITLFQIKAEMSFGNVIKGELGGWIEKEENLSQDGDAWVSGNAWVYGNAQVSGNARVSGNAWVYGNAWVFGDARLSLKASFTLGWFIGGDDSGKITEITDKTGSTYWKKQYVLGDYKIEEIKDEVETLKIGDKTYSKQEVEDALKNIKSIN
jgi:carbonic anhydrase/acetyltransferase-like protein (isoleucine patch superfamily)